MLNRISYKKLKLRFILFTIMLLLISGTMHIFSADAPDALYYGDMKAASKLRNLDFVDLTSINIATKPAIYQAGALEIIKALPNASKKYNRTAAISKEEAIAIVYRAAGKEADAQILGENLNNARSAAEKKKDVLQVWYDGFLQLAANEGLISQLQLADALNTDQNSLDSGAFKRRASVQRQEMAFWISKALNIEPVRNQQDILNNYLDWRNSDPEKVPFIETILQNRIMNGDGKGRFNPTKALTREQAAQIVKNAESYILAALKYDKMTGTIDTITTKSDFLTGSKTSGKNIDITNSTGSFHRISTGILNSGINEQSGAVANPISRELVVYKNGVIGNSSLLKKGDRIEYIYQLSDNSVKFINVMSNVSNESYIVAQINSIDKRSQLMNVIRFFDLDFPDMSLLKQNVSFQMINEAGQTAYRYSKSIKVLINEAKSSIDSLSPDSIVILTINNNNIITAVQSVDFGINSEENSVVKGIVEEINPDLGYITLYNEDGTGTGKNMEEQLLLLRTFNYLNANTLEVFKNHTLSRLENLENGDSVFLKLDASGNVTSISAIDNYSVKYGRIISRLPEKIVVEYENGGQMVLQVDDNVLFIKDKKLTRYDSLMDGDRVRLILNITKTSTTLKEVTIEGMEHYVANIYKGEVSYIDTVSEKLVVMNTQIFNKGKWERTPTKGFTSIPLSEGSRIYFENKLIDINRVNKQLRNNEAYIAVEKDYGGEEKAVFISYKVEEDTEVLYKETINSAFSAASSIVLNGLDKNISYGAGSIVVKNARLVAGGSLTAEDLAYAAVNRSYNTGEYKAGVVVVEDKIAEPTQIYRARIKAIDENNNFEVESFSQLTDSNWQYYNTPKIFNLGFNTTLLGEEGVVDMREFIGYGSSSYIGRTVYVLADATDAVVISTAPFGMINVKGIAYEVSGGEIGEEGTLLTEPDTIKLRSAKIFNPTTYIWDNVKDMNIDILKNSVIIKRGVSIKPSDIKAGDDLRIIKKDNSLTGDAYVIMVID